MEARTDSVESIQQAAKLPGTRQEEGDAVDCDLVVVICCGWNNTPKTGGKCGGMLRRSWVNLHSELRLLRHWEQDVVDMRTFLQIACGWTDARSVTRLWARTHDEQASRLRWLPRRLAQTYWRADHRVDDAQQYAEFVNFASTAAALLFREYVKPAHKADVWLPLRRSIPGLQARIASAAIQLAPRAAGFGRAG